MQPESIVEWIERMIQVSRVELIFLEGIGRIHVTQDFAQYTIGVFIVPVVIFKDDIFVFKYLGKLDLYFVGYEERREMFIIGNTFI